MYTFKRSVGFTLIELMITVAIIGILAAIAYPSYTEYVTKAKRSDAKAALLQVQLAEEKWRANNINYGTLDQIGVNAISPDKYYDIGVTVVSATTTVPSTYTATAAPKSPFVDSKCGTFAVNQNGKLYTSYADANCWGK